ncbi:MAG: ribosome assembly cofactor RimP [Spirochaetaceae bacterium]|jgi:ribosome maturation factor RimP|nr:ribosome assembly cofactor RimP [Spirochaetaceae bacterium]
MRYTPRVADKVFDSIEAVVKGLAMSLVELSVSQRKGCVQVRAVIYRDAGGVASPDVGINDCAGVHRAILPRLELAFPGQDIYVEVSSPGIERRIKDGAEFVHYIGRPVTCYRTDISGWTSGVLIGADDNHIVIKGKNGMTSLSYDTIAKAKLTCLAEISEVAQSPRRNKEAAL